MSTVSPIQPLDSKPDLEPEDLYRIRTRLIIHLASALDAALQRLQLAAAGQSVFATDLDLKATASLLHLLPSLLDALPDSPPFRMEDCHIPLIPKCEICGDGPGAHWTDDCPQREPGNPDHDHLVHITHFPADPCHDFDQLL